MKKTIVGAISALIVIGALPASAAAGKKQEVSGTIALPAPYTDDTGCYAGIHRRLSLLTMGAANGVVGYEFDLDKATYNKPFVLESTGGQGSVQDLDMYFYQSFGTVDQVVSDPLNAGAPATISFNTRAAGGESGIVPKGFTKGIVCMYGGSLGAGLAGSFEYVAGAGVKVKKS